MLKVYLKNLSKLNCKEEWDFPDVAGLCISLPGDTTGANCIEHDKTAHFLSGDGIRPQSGEGGYEGKGYLIHPPQHLL
jgi:hypothetical protein